MYLKIVLNIYCVLFIQSSYFIILFRFNNGNVKKSCWGEHGSILESIYCIEIIMAMLGKAVEENMVVY